MPLASIPQFYFPGGAEPVDEDVKQQFVVNVNALFDPHPSGLNLEQFSAVVQEVRSSSKHSGRSKPLVSSMLAAAMRWQLLAELQVNAVIVQCERSVLTLLFLLSALSPLSALGVSVRCASCPPSWLTPGLSGWWGTAARGLSASRCS